MTDGIKVHARSLPSSRQRGLDGIVHVVAIDQLMDAQALFADGVWKAACIAGEYLANGGEAPHGVQPASDRGQLVWRAAAAAAMDRVNDVANAVDGIADGMGKIVVQQQKLQNA